MKPELVDVASISRALQPFRPSDATLEERWVACVLDHGIEALPPELRARAIHAIGCNPELAALVAELDDPESFRAVSADSLRFTGVWRMAFAASALLAAGLSIWFVNQGSASHATPGLLDGSAPATGAAGGLRGVELLVLLLAWLLVGATALPAFVVPGLAARADRSRAMRRHAGE